MYGRRVSWIWYGVLPGPDALHQNPLMIQERLLFLIRSLHAGVAVLIPAVTGFCLGVSVALLTLNRRHGVNALTWFLGRFGAWIAGMRVEVRGAPPDGFKGPALVVLNHQSGLDPIIVCYVLKTNLLGIAKQELKFNPLLGPLFWFLGSIFVDRNDREQRRNALRPVREALARGLLIVVAPEGRRQSMEPLGPFRSGGFRLALETGVPVIPLVIHDSRELLAPRRTDLRPGTVHVDVLPAIDTRAWRTAAGQEGEVDALTLHVHEIMRAALEGGEQ